MARIVFVTGKLAEPALRRVLSQMAPLPFEADVQALSINVAALLTPELIKRKLATPIDADKVVLPGRCRGDLDELARHFGVPFERGPDELKDLPLHFGRKARRPDLSRHDVTIFAEIVDAPELSMDALLERARRLVADGADVIDLGCLPGVAFPALEEAVGALKSAGFKVSVDSLNTNELRRGAGAGADFLLSLTEHTLPLVDEFVHVTPVLIPAGAGDLDSLARAIRACEARGRAFLADPILDPIHHGFVESLVRYRSLRATFPSVSILMGVGNVTELTEADTSGINAVLFGIISELRLNAVLTTQVSKHARRAVREADLARRIMFAARADNDLPRRYDDGLATVHSSRPFPDSPTEIAELARQVRDPNFRIQVAEDGVHVYNRDGHWVATDPFDLYEHLSVADDGAHAFYLGAELARAQIAWQLGKRYEQDEELDWGVAADRRPPDLSRHRAPGATMQARRGRRKAAGDAP